MQPQDPPLVNDLRIDQQDLLRHYSEGCYRRYMEFRPFIKPSSEDKWVANCMQFTLNSIHRGTETWDRIQSVVAAQK